MINRFLHIIISCFIAYIANSQQLNFVNISNSLNLPSQETYSVTQDKQGYIWIATEQGFCRYDGKTTKVYDRRNGLPEGGVYSVVEDKKGRLWLLTSKKRILILENGKLREAPFSRKCARQILPYDLMYRLVLKNSRLYIFSKRETFVVDVNTNRLVKVVKSLEKNLNAVFKLVNDDELITENMYLKIKEPAYRMQKAYFFRFINTKKRIQSTIRVPSNQIFFGEKYIVTSIKGHHYIGMDNQLLRVDNNGNYTLHAFENKILSLNKDCDGGLWIGLLNGGFLYYKNGNLNRQPITGLTKYSVSGIYEDKEHTLWCSTIERGIFQVKNKTILNYYNIPGLDVSGTLLTAIHNKVFFSSKNSTLFQLSDKISSLQLKESLPGQLKSLILFDGHYIIGESSMCLIGDLNFKNIVVSKLYDQGSHRLFSGIAMARSFKDCIWVGANGNIIYIDKNLHPHLKAHTYLGITCFEFLDQSTILLGNSDGLYNVNLNTGKIFKYLDDTKVSIADMIRIDQETIWIATKGSGLFEYRNGRLTNLTDKLKIPSRVLTDLVKDESGFIWIASNVGLICLKKSGKKWNIYAYSLKHGLPSNNIQKLAITKERIFFSSPEGLGSMPLNGQFYNKLAPPVFLRKYMVQNREKEITFNRLDYSRNALFFRFDVLSFKDIGGNKIFYGLIKDGINYKTEFQSGNELELENLSPGTYDLAVFGVNSDGFKSKKPFRFHFEILPPFWQTGWFISLMVLFLILIVYGIVRLSSYRIRKKEKEKNRIQQLLAESQLSALQAQMNPHFIFNAINSIQNYILKKQEREAYDYLAKFSKLIRIVLHNSQQKMLTLDEELETINLYVSLEQLRFQEKFEFVLTVDPAINMYETMIPTMFIQPYLENAIWHGIMPLENRKGILTLYIEVRNNMLHIEIEDNGVGRHAAIEKNNVLTKNHQPFAMRLTQERINVVGMMLGSDQFKIEILDKGDADGVSLGTKIVVDLPLIIKDE